MKFAIIQVLSALVACVPIPTIMLKSISSPTTIIGGSETVTVTVRNSGDSQGFGPFVDISLAPGFEVTSASCFSANLKVNFLTLSMNTTAPHPFSTGSWSSNSSNPNFTTPYASAVLPFLGMQPDLPNADVVFTVRAVGPTAPGPQAPICTRFGYYLGTADSEDNAATDPPIFTAPASPLSGWSCSGSSQVVLAPIITPPNTTTTSTPGVFSFVVSAPSGIVPQDAVTYQLVFLLSIPTNATLASGSSVNVTFPPFVDFVSVTAGSTTPTVRALPTAGNGRMLMVNLTNPVLSAAPDIPLFSVSFQVLRGALPLNSSSVTVPFSAQFSGMNATVRVGPLPASAYTTLYHFTGNFQPFLAASIADNVGSPNNYTAFTPGDTFQYSAAVTNPYTYLIASGSTVSGLAMAVTLSDGLNLVDASSPVVGVEVVKSGVTYSQDTVLGVTRIVGSDPRQFTVLISTLLSASFPGQFPGGNLTSTTTSIRIFFKGLTQDRYDAVPANRNLLPQDMVMASVSNSWALASSPGTPSFLSGITSSTATAESPSYIPPHIYARSGVICNPQPCRDMIFSPEDTATFRAIYRVPFGDTGGVTIQIFSPGPVMPVSGSATFDSAAGSTAAPPAPFVGKRGPTDTFTNLPNLTTSATSNWFKFTYAAMSYTPNLPLMIDVLFTVPVISIAGYPDGFPLVVVSYFAEGGGVSSSAASSTTTSIIFSHPKLDVALGFVRLDLPNTLAILEPAAPSANAGLAFPTSAPACSPTASPLSSFTALDSTKLRSKASMVDAGDVLVGAVTIINRGSGRAFNISLALAFSDSTLFSTGFPVSQICAVDGAGTAVSLTSLGSSKFNFAGPFAGTKVGTPNTVVMIMTFFLTLSPSVRAGFTANTVTATIEAYYAIASGGPNLSVPAAISFTTSFGIAPLRVTSFSVTNSTISQTTASEFCPTCTDITPGEVVTLVAVIAVPEGTLPSPFVVTITALSPAITAWDTASMSLTAPVATFGVLPAVTKVSSASSATFTVSSAIVNTPEGAGVDPASGNAITVSVGVMTTGLNSNSLVFSLAASSPFSFDASAATVQLDVVEPTLCHSSSIVSSSGDAMDTVTISTTLSHCPSSSSSPVAFEVSLSAFNPTIFVPVTGSANVSGTGSAGCTGSATSSSAAMNCTTLVRPLTATFTYSAKLSTLVAPGSSFYASSKVTYRPF